MNGEAVTKYHSEWRSVVLYSTNTLDVHLKSLAANAVLLLLRGSLADSARLSLIILVIRSFSILFIHSFEYAKGVV